MIIHRRCLLPFLTISLLVAVAHAQQPAVPKEAAPPPDVNKTYWEMSRSKDSKFKNPAAQYLALVRYQEWSTLSGKTTVAKYVSHDANLSHVKLAVARGSGKDRVVKEYDVEVDKLTKTCQYRVKRIDDLAKKLDELATTFSKQGNAGVGPSGPGGPGASPEGPGGVGPAERGTETRSNAGPGGIPAQPGAASPSTQSSEPDASASEPDPLGFAELPPVAGGPAGGPGTTPPAGPGSIPPAGPGTTLPVGPGTAPPNLAASPPTPAASERPGATDRKQWRNSVAGFAATFTVGTDPTGKPTIDWGELAELRQLNELALAKQPGAPQPPEPENPAAISERIGDVRWQIVVDKVVDAPGGMAEVQFHPVSLAKPLELRIALDDAENRQKWVGLAPGATVQVTGRLMINEPYKIVAKVRLAAAK